MDRFSDGYSNYYISLEDGKRVAKWLKEVVYPKVIAHQKKTIKNPDWTWTSSWDSGYPYEGAIGGAVSYIFAPRSIGTSIKVKYHAPWRKKGDFVLDLTDYDSW